MNDTHHRTPGNMEVDRVFDVQYGGNEGRGMDKDDIGGKNGGEGNNKNRELGKDNFPDTQAPVRSTPLP